MGSAGFVAAGAGLALALAAGALAACGKKGPPVAPELRVPAGPSALQGAVDERSIVVSWTGPERRLDGSRLRAVSLYKLYRRDDFREIFNVKGNYFLTYPVTERYIERANPWSRDFVNGFSSMPILQNVR